MLKSLLNQVILEEKRMRSESYYQSIDNWVELEFDKDDLKRMKHSYEVGKTVQVGGVHSLNAGIFNLLLVVVAVGTDWSFPVFVSRRAEHWRGGAVGAGALLPDAETKQHAGGCHDNPAQHSLPAHQVTNSVAASLHQFNCICNRNNVLRCLSHLRKSRS